MFISKVYFCQPMPSLPPTKSEFFPCISESFRLCCIQTLQEKPIALVLNCEEGIDTRDRLNKAFTEQLVDSSYINSNFGYELNPDEGNLFEKRKINNMIKNYNKEGKSLPVLNIDEIDKFADYINDMIEKRVD